MLIELCLYQSTGAYVCHKTRPSPLNIHHYQPSTPFHMSVSSGLQPLFDFYHALVYRESGTLIPVLEPCDGGELFEVESSGLNCSDICLDNEILSTQNYR